MKKSLIVFLILLNTINNNLYSQENIKSQFYELKVPTKTTVKTFNSSREELSNIDSYQFIFEEKPKYILYLMSNKLNKEISNINFDNYKDFLSDLGDLKVSGIEEIKDKIKVNFIYNNNQNIKGIIYLSVNNNILNRFVFLLPNDNAKKVFENEIDEIISNIIYYKNYW